MGMQEDFTRIKKLMARWVADIDTHNAVDFLDINKYGEDIALQLLNEIFSFNLINLNSINKHYPAADLGNPGTGFAFQVTSRSDADKIRSSLDTFKENHLAAVFPGGLRFLLLTNKRTKWNRVSKESFAGIWPGFDSERDIIYLPDLIVAMKTVYHQDPGRFARIMNILEREFSDDARGKESTSPLERLWQGSRAYYEALRGVNGRFRFLNISDILFTGTESQWLDTSVEIEEKSQDPSNKKFYGGPGPRGAGDLLEQSPGRRRQKKLTISNVLPMLWQHEVKHAVIIGEGGMGKTVSLIHWWEKLLDSDEPVKPLPVFIALNEFNQVKEIKREDFIISSVVENYGKKGGEPVTADQVKAIMETPLGSAGGFIPSVVLLLDGFNEITVEKRQLLLELNHLTEQFPGLQVVITGRRDMRPEFNWSHWHPVRLKALEDEQVEEYLRVRGSAGTAGPVKGEGRLWVLLKNPMMLTLFAATSEVLVKHRDSPFCSFKAGVDSPGELLWNFIEAQVALLPDKVGPGEDRQVYYWFLLKYVLPGLGFAMEKEGLFAFSHRQFRDHLDSLCRRLAQEDFLETVPRLGRYVKSLPLGECGEAADRLERAARLREIFCGEMHMLVEEGEMLRFLHQDFRDFFAAVHVLNEVEVGIGRNEIPEVLQERILDYYVRRYMGEIEGEHRCKPYLVEGEGWKIDINKENRLYRALELSRIFTGSRGGFFKKSPWPPEAKGNLGYAVFNIVTTWKEVRGELTGADLRGLDLRGVQLNGVRCSRFYDPGDGRGCRYLGADFDGSRVQEKNLLSQGHTGTVTSAVYSGDGKKILSASWDKTIKVWDAGTCECLKTLIGHSDIVWSAVANGEGEKILSASDDKTIKVWDVGTGECVKTLAGYSSWVRSAMYSGDDKKILSASYDHTIKELDADTGQCVKTLAGHTGWVRSAVYNADGKKILSASYDRTIKEWDADTGRCVKTLSNHTDAVMSAVYSGDGKKILSASSDVTIKEWDAGTGECVKTLVGHTNVVWSAVYSPDGKKILSASEDKTIKEWDTGTGECVKTLAGHTNIAWSAVYSVDGKKILSASGDNTIKEWDADTGECVKTLAGYKDRLLSAVVSRDGKKILSTSDDHTIKEWDAGTGECVKTLAGHTGTVYSAVYSGDGKKILSASDDDTIKEWDARTGQCLKTHKIADKPDLSQYPTAAANSKLNIYENIIYAPAAAGEEKERKLINIPGLFIQGCSFRNLEKGSQWTEEGLRILKQYGGIVE